MSNIKFLAAKIIVFVLPVIGLISQPVYAVPITVPSGTAVFDYTSAYNQLEQYLLEYDKYQNMVQNTTAPLTSIWSQASSTMNQFQGLMGGLPQYSNGVNSFLTKFPTLQNYTSNTCISTNSCTSADLATLQNTQIEASNAQMSANQAALETINHQQTALQTDAYNLQQIQTGAQGATGQLQAIGYSNQIAAQQAYQTMQLRATLLAQQNAETTRNIALANQKAQEDATAKLLNNTNSISTPSPARSW